MSKKPKLSDIPGLGPKTVEKLEEAGIKTVYKLSKMKAERLSSKVDGIGETTAQQYIDEALKLVPSESKPKKDTKTKEKKSEIKEKKTKLSDIDGLGPKTVEKLEEAGIKTISMLSEMTVDELSSKVDGIGETTAQQYIDAAKALVPSIPKREKSEKRKPKVEEKKPEVKVEKPPKKAKKPKPEAPAKVKAPAPKLKKKPKKKSKKRKAKKVEPKPELLTRQQVVESRAFRLAAAKKHKQPSFRHEQAHRWIRISDSWRKVRGIDSKTREKRKGRPAMPNAGYRKPKIIRGIHPSGYIEVQVYRPSELDKLNPDVHAVRIGSTVGLKKRQDILKKAETLMLRVLNPGAPETVVEEELFSELDMLDEVDIE
jgi:large subunit ribosomal protein L32e